MTPLPLHTKPTLSIVSELSYHPHMKPLPHLPLTQPAKKPPRYKKPSSPPFQGKNLGQSHQKVVYSTRKNSCPFSKTKKVTMFWGRVNPTLCPTLSRRMKTWALGRMWFRLRIHSWKVRKMEQIFFFGGGEGHFFVFVK